MGDVRQKNSRPGANQGGLHGGRHGGRVRDRQQSTIYSSRRPSQKNPSAPSGVVLAAWWWIDRWRKSTAFTDMTLAEQGAYRNLIDELWLRNGLLPKDERILARACGDAVEWPNVREKVMRHFVETSDGYRNETHDSIHQESRKRAEKQSRYRNKSGNVTGNVTPSPSPSPSPSQEPDPVTDTSSASALAPAAKKPRPDTWLTPYAEAWSEQFGGEPNFGQLAAELGLLHKAHGPEKTLDHWRRFLQQSDPKYVTPNRFKQTFGSWEEGAISARKPDAGTTGVIARALARGRD